MAPIINPMWFYWLSVVDSARTISTGAMLFGVFTLIASAVSYAIDSAAVQAVPRMSEAEKRRLPFWKKAVVISVICIAVCTVVVIFAPSKETMIEMIIARYATYDNAEWTIDTIRSMADYIVEAVKSVNGG